MAAHPVLTIGNFDGVHLGHQRIIGLALEKARARRGAAVAMTFRPHPQAVLRPDLPLQLLTSYDEKLELLRGSGLDEVIEQPFTHEFSSIAPRDFFREVVLKVVGAEALVVGYDFSFGKDRQGNLTLLDGICRESKVELTVVPPQKIQDEVISSSRIRKLLLSGDVEMANRLLGREFSYRGVVIRGEGRGRKLGFPTANLQLEDKLTLPYGVYVTQVQVGRQILPSVTNVGVRPTFTSATGGLPVLVETHLLDTTMDLYGQTLSVRFICRLREERKFSGPDALKSQILADCDQARALLKARAP